MVLKTEDQDEKACTHLAFKVPIYSPILNKYQIKIFYVLVNIPL